MLKLSFGCPLRAEIRVVQEGTERSSGGTRSVSTWRRVRPGIRVQNRLMCRIEAMTVQIFKVKGLARSVHLASTWQVVRRGRYRRCQRHAARILQERTELPIPRDQSRQVVGEIRLRLVQEVDRENVRLVCGLNALCGARRIENILARRCQCLRERIRQVRLQPLRHTLRYFHLH